MSQNHSVTVVNEDERFVSNMDIEPLAHSIASLLGLTDEQAAELAEYGETYSAIGRVEVFVCHCNRLDLHQD